MHNYLQIICLCLLLSNAINPHPKVFVEKKTGGWSNYLIYDSLFLIHLASELKDFQM